MNRREAIEYMIGRDWPIVGSYNHVAAPDDWEWHEDDLTVWLHKKGEFRIIEEDLPLARPHIDGVKRPSHYDLLDGFEAIDVIAASLTAEQWRGYCLGNIMKYRLRAGKKAGSDALKDIAKADEYKSLYELHKDKTK